MKLLTKSTILSLLLIVALTTAAFAAPLFASTTKTLSTNFTLVNVEAAEATVLASYYKSDGSPWAAAAGYTNFTIPGNYGQKILAQYATDSGMDAGQGSAVISSDKQLGSVVQVLARGQTPTSSAYTGFAAGSTTFYAPFVIRMRTTSSGLNNTQIMIQNTESTAITADVQFIASPGSGFANWSKLDIPVPANSTYYYDVADESSANLPDGWFGSAVVAADSGKKIAVVVSVFAGPNSMQTYKAFAAETAYTAWAIPQFASKLSNGLNMSVSVQNVSGATIPIGGITLDCVPTTGFTGTITKSNTAAVEANASFVFNPYNNPDYPDAWSGSCTVTSTSGNVVTYVINRAPGRNENIAAWEAFPTNSTATTVVVPLASKYQANGFATVTVIQNLDKVNQALVHLTYTRAEACTVGAASYEFDVTIAAGGNYIENLRLVDGGPAGMPAGWYGTLLVKAQPATTARPLVAYIQLTNYKNPAGDTGMAHTAVLLP
jgi:hypothetical protein